MSHEPPPRQLTLAGVAHRCAQETAHFFQRQPHDPRYCFELLRRAIVERDEQAWELVYNQYRPLVASWVERHPAFPASGEEAQSWVNQAFAKFWMAITPAKFNRFTNLNTLLRYLQMCVHSVLLDELRRTNQAVIGTQAESVAAASASWPNDSRVEDQAVDRVRQQELWKEIEARLREEKERRVVYGSFVLALKPRDICARYPETFHDVKEIYRIKENVLSRLRRDTELGLLIEDA